VNWNAAIAVTLFILTDIVVWFQINAQFLDGWWKKHALILCAACALPVAFGYYFAWSYSAAAFGSWWGTRFIAFALSFLVFPILTHYLLGESMFTAKTTICVMLALCILGVQTLR
tara:strand:- start:439 stop:783 length:345 start_codon:yes stop_codon:yes gene_type:complete